MARTLWYLSLLLILILAVPAVSGTISIQNVVISPSGDLISGQKPPTYVSVSYKVVFFPEGGVTFSSSDTLGMSTDLDNARWNYTVLVDSVPNIQKIVNGNSVDISGWELSYNSRRDISIQVRLTGDVPVVSATGKKTLVRVADNNVNGPVPGSEVKREAIIILPEGAAVPTATSGTETPGVTAQQTSPVTNLPEAGPAAKSVSISPEIFMAIFLLISFIPLGLLVFHDYFGLGRLSFPQDFRVRAGTAVMYALCGAGLLFVLSVLQYLYTSLDASNSGITPAISLVVLFLASYFTLSAFVLASGAILSKAFRWTLRMHMVIGIIVLFAVPATLFALGSIAGRDVAAAIAIVAALASGLLALLQEHSVAQDLGKDWYTSIRDFFRRAETRVIPQRDTHSESAAAIAILNTRLAKGEISLQEYNELKEAMRK
jgi:hypothetical protein